MKESKAEMILSATFTQEDKTIMRELGPKANDLTLRINFIVDKLIFHQFGNYVL